MSEFKARCCKYTKKRKKRKKTRMIYFIIEWKPCTLSTIDLSFCFYLVWNFRDSVSFRLLIYFSFAFFRNLFFVFLLLLPHDFLSLFLHSYCCCCCYFCFFCMFLCRSIIIFSSVFNVRVYVRNRRKRRRRRAWLVPFLKRRLIMKTGTFHPWNQFWHGNTLVMVLEEKEREHELKRDG